VSEFEKPVVGQVSDTTIGGALDHLCAPPRPTLSLVILKQPNASSARERHLNEIAEQDVNTDLLGPSSLSLWRVTNLLISQAPDSWTQFSLRRLFGVSVDGTSIERVRAADIAKVLRIPCGQANQIIEDGRGFVAQQLEAALDGRLIINPESRNINLNPSAADRERVWKLLGLNAWGSLRVTEGVSIGDVQTAALLHEECYGHRLEKFLDQRDARKRRRDVNASSKLSQA
jgi:hypothetical protein